MKEQNNEKFISYSGVQTTNATAQHSMSFDTRDSDYLNLLVSCASHASTTALITEILVYEHDTTTTATSMTIIPAVSSATETSTSASNVLPTAATMAKGGIVNEIQLDLKARKRYIGVALKTDTIAGPGVGFSINARLSDNKESTDSAADKSGVNLASTHYQGCMAVLTA